MEIDAIIQKILQNLNRNGFPDKKVSFPKNSLEQFVKKHDYDLEDVLGEMRLNDCHTRIEKDRIVFSSTAWDEGESGKNSWDFSSLKNMDPQKLREKADELMKHMTPEQLASIRSKVDNLSPEEKQKLMQSARDMGFI